MRKYWDILTTVVIISLGLQVLWLTNERERVNANAVKIDQCVKAKKPTCEVDGIKIYITYRKGIVTMRKKP